MNIKTIDRPAVTLVGLQIRTRPQSPEIPALWPKFVARIGEIHGQSEPKVTYGAMWPGKEGMHVLHYMAAVAVAGPVRVLPPGMDCIVLPAGIYASFSYPLSGLGKGFAEIFDTLLPNSGYEQVPGVFFERYDEAFCPDDANSAVGICLPVRRRGARAGARGLSA
ncbi:MAG TPA: GyrI-like domain-containing protein [Steroidobacteraceae bacterium]|jgi:AraC family transcriptional regulator|nr:GyrI-like domain-containing protein [Steroidobacteraceae bacterium]